jgi:hypothetical protein
MCKRSQRVNFTGYEGRVVCLGEDLMMNGVNLDK